MRTNEFSEEKMTINELSEKDLASISGGFGTGAAFAQTWIAYYNQSHPLHCEISDVTLSNP